ncbi:MAG: GIY-YIG nuclease family protein [Sarcina ventriculi]|uniref:GIY-YIG nuclease superfamily protein n=1 Tax=Sarcina ventriculi TaxID=1267 RepID=A0ABM9UNH8_SARVE|nr:GIY-YIG nuclease family protein [Sarcina ventriculi]MDO4402770.1 GIY-YIG nuclease family protein [Clostridiaceae bacterium]MBU5322264.1 GIY-YIG nuclease family protein [Sarcina ventriculi]MDD7374131.1 GIY-YIG nuclease family protein [Sarcina ventriculi]MDY7061308.1 GIY-YIG nuclease family protein [Sarcina ventriculi]CUN64873.1 GIY-YIG nuclease superfamily protein [Sarcina ventriculi]
MNYTYILECSDGSFYTGWTNNLEKRINCHNKGKGAKYTKGRLPVKLVYFEEFIEKRDAQKREYVIKHLTRNNKLNLIKDFNLLNLERS